MPGGLQCSSPFQALSGLVYLSGRRVAADSSWVLCLRLGALFMMIADLLSLLLHVVFSFHHGCLHDAHVPCCLCASRILSKFWENAPRAETRGGVRCSNAKVTTVLSMDLRRVVASYLVQKASFIISVAGGCALYIRESTYMKELLPPVRRSNYVTPM